MGLFDFLPCCGRRSVEDKDDEPTDTDPLLAPVRRGAESITSQEGYGAVSMSASDSGGLSGAQRARIAEIGREVGNHMLPINQASRAATTSPSARVPSTSGGVRPPSPDSTSSPSRPTTPSPAHGDGEYGSGSGVLSPPEDDAESSSRHNRSGAATPADGASAAVDADGVVHKTLFHGSNPNNRGSHGKGSRGKKGGRGRGRGRSKKMK